MQKLVAGRKYAGETGRTQIDLASIHVNFHCHLQATGLFKEHALVVSFKHGRFWASPLDVTRFAYQGATITVQQIKSPMKPARRAGMPS
jgi:hypothetical protein